MKTLKRILFVIIFLASLVIGYYLGSLLLSQFTEIRAKEWFIDRVFLPLFICFISSILTIKLLQ